MDVDALGIHLGDLKRSVRDGLTLASRMGFRSIELPAAKGDASPDQLSGTGRRDLVRVAGGLGLTTTALSADLPSHALANGETIDEAVMRTSRIIMLARDLGVSRVRLPVATLGNEKGRDNVIEGLRALSAVADGNGVLLTIQPVRDEAEVIKPIMEAVGSDSLGVCLDPGELMMTGREPPAMLAEFGESLWLCHLRDATAGNADRGGRETRWGEGDVDWLRWLASLESSGFSGPQILRCTESDDPVEELTQARDALLKSLGLFR